MSRFGQKNMTQAPHRGDGLAERAGRHQLQETAWHLNRRLEHNRTRGAACQHQHTATYPTSHEQVKSMDNADQYQGWRAAYHGEPGLSHQPDRMERVADDHELGQADGRVSEAIILVLSP
jgi:hypothetical protein